jgi:hypothetical protein
VQAPCVARVYDPIVQRFLSADGMVESPFSTQGWNRYAYVGNNPLAFTDPSGASSAASGSPSSMRLGRSSDTNHSSGRFLNWWRLSQSAGRSS